MHHSAGVICQLQVRALRFDRKGKKKSIIFGQATKINPIHEKTLFLVGHVLVGSTEI